MNQNKNQITYKNVKSQNYYVRRDKQILVLASSQFQIGDFVLFKKGDVIKVDGIIIFQNNSNIQVILNQQRTRKGTAYCKKISYDKADYTNQINTLVYVNSKVLSGQFWMLVCRLQKKQNSYKLQNTKQSLFNLQRRGKTVSVIVKWVVASLILIFGGEWLSKNNNESYQLFLQFIYVLASLLLYLSVVDQHEIVFHMKRFIKSELLTSHYHIYKKQFLQYINKSNIIIIQASTLQNINSEILKQKLSLLNIKFDVKILFDLEQPNHVFQSIYGTDISDQVIFVHEPQKTVCQRFTKLIESKFIFVNKNIFMQYYLRSLISMKYHIIYVSNNQVPLKVIGIYVDNKQNKIINNRFQISLLQDHNISKIQSNYKNQQQLKYSNIQWIKIYGQQKLLDTLLELRQKSNIISQLKQSYYFTLANSCIQLLILVGWAYKGCLVDLNLNLLVFFFNRNRQTQLSTTWIDFSKNQKIQETTKNSLFQRTIFKYNLLLIPYYCYMMLQVSQSPQKPFKIFLLLMNNRFFRIIGLLPNKYIEVKQNIIKLSILLVFVGIQWFITWRYNLQFDIQSSLLNIILLPLIVMFYSKYF